MELITNKKYSIKEIIKLFKENGYDISIYNGLREHCRCGCGGKYYDNDISIINRVINKYGNLKLKYKSDYIAKHRGYINEFSKHWDNINNAQYYIEFGTQGKNYYDLEEDTNKRRCYAIYFKLNKEVL